METLIFKQTKDTDLYIGLKVSYNDTYGMPTNTGVITDIIMNSFGEKLYLVAGALYLACELTLLTQK